MSEAQIRNFVRDWAFVETVISNLRELLYSNRTEQYWRGRDVREDIETLKEFFRTEIGATWSHATRATTRLAVTIGADRTMPPWREVAQVMGRRGADAPHAYIREYIVGMTPYFQWQA